MKIRRKSYDVHRKVTALHKVLRVEFRAGNFGQKWYNKLLNLHPNSGITLSTEASSERVLAFHTNCPINLTKLSNKHLKYHQSKA